MHKLIWSLAGVAIILSLIICKQGHSLVEVKESRPVMGTIANITIYDRHKQSAHNAIEAVFNEIARIEDRISTFRPGSDAWRLNHDKQVIDPSSDLRFVIQKALDYSKLSEGAFDITVQPILDLYKKCFLENKRPPTDEEIRATLKHVGYQRINLSANAIAIGSDQTITLGALGHGYAVDQVIDILKKKGIQHALVDIGGEIRVIGIWPGHKRWTVAIENPRKNGDYVSRVALPPDKAVVTSGDYEDFYDKEKKFHHIINPLSGYSATELISVTIIADTALDANALSVSVFVLGEEKGLKLIQSLSNVEGLLITRDRKIWKSKGFDGFVSN